MCSPIKKEKKEHIKPPKGDVFPSGRVGQLSQCLLILLKYDIGCHTNGPITANKTLRIGCLSFLLSGAFLGTVKTVLMRSKSRLSNRQPLQPPIVEILIQPPTSL